MENEDKKNENKNVGIGCLTVVVIMIVAYFIFSPSKETEMAIDAYVTTQTHVKKYLKSPASAEFQPFRKEIVKKTGENSFEINSYVDSQNGFGAMLRSKYLIRMHKNGDDWFCDYFELDGKRLN